MKKERWKKVKVDGSEWPYEVSDLGNVRREGKGRNLTKRVVNGRWHVMLYNGPGVRRYCMVHRLVAEAFVRNPKGYNRVGRKNDDQLDVKAKNLKWKAEPTRAAA